MVERLDALILVVLAIAALPACGRTGERMTDAFSKKWENLQAAYALHFAYYNFCRVQSTLKVTPAMAAGLTDHRWSIGELLMAGFEIQL
jgi:hypothetical protein